MVTSVTDEDVLRAKYLDWCSARLADHFLRLTPGEIYELAQEVPGGAEGAVPAWQVASALVASGGVPHAASSTAGGLDASGPRDRVPAPESYRMLVERVASVLAARLSIPSFEDWVESYRAEPNRYEDELLGFWKALGPGG